MFAKPDSSQNWAFGAFELEGRTAELRRNGLAVRLQEQPAQILLFLLQHAGQIVTREGLRIQLWPADTFVDFDHALNTAVMKLLLLFGLSSLQFRLHSERERLARKPAWPRLLTGDCTLRSVHPNSEGSPKAHSYEVNCI